MTFVKLSVLRIFFNTVIRDRRNAWEEDLPGQSERRDTAGRVSQFYL